MTTTEWKPRQGNPLSPRQLEALSRIADGQPWQQIGRSMGITINGVGSLNKQILQKLGASTAAHAVRLACAQGLLVVEPALVLPVPLVQVLELVADGRTNAAIARILGRSEHTVVDQVKEARRRLGARDRAHAAALAVALRIVRVQVPAPAPTAAVDAA